MSTERIHGIEVEVEGEHSHEGVHNLVKSWRENEHNFHEARHAVDNHAMNKLHLGGDHSGSHVTFEKRDGKYILRKSS